MLGLFSSGGSLSLFNLTWWKGQGSNLRCRAENNNQKNTRSVANFATLPFGAHP